MKQGEEGCSLYRFKASIALLGMSAAVVRQRGKKTAMDKQTKSCR